MIKRAGAAVFIEYSVRIFFLKLYIEVLFDLFSASNDTSRAGDQERVCQNAGRIDCVSIVLF